MATAINGFTPTTATSNASLPAKTLTGSDFLNLMIQQLAQQDPLNPTDSNQLLTQMSQISQLQSNTAMEASLKGLTLQQSIGAGGNLIGKSVKGLDEDGRDVDGTVTSVKVENRKVFLELETGDRLPMENVYHIATTGGATSLADGLALAQKSGLDMQGLLAMLAGKN